MSERALTWDQAYARLEQWAARQGHARVPQGYVAEDGFRLGKWVHNQRTRYRARAVPRAGVGPLGDEQVHRLEAVPGWVWSTRGAGRAAPVAGTAVAVGAAVGTMSAGEFSRAVSTLTCERVLAGWLSRHPGRNVSVEDVARDAAFVAEWQREQVRVSLAGLVAAGVVSVGTESGPLGWEAVLVDPDVERWSVRSVRSAPEGQALLPVAVLAAYQAASSQRSLPIC